MRRPRRAGEAIAALGVGLLLAFPAGAQEPERAGDDPAEAVQELVTVTATRLPLELARLAGKSTLLSAEQLRLSAAPGIDEALRRVPQFALFRRSPARGTHPTAQGANLRGVAPSGTSRALVLLDGVPLNDAFGGWIGWSRIPQVAVERVEIALGGGSASWGSAALGGVVAIETARPPSPGGSLRVRARGGSQSTALLGAAAGAAGNAGSALIATEIYDTGGYLAIAPAEAGAVDAPVAARHVNGVLRLQHVSGLRLAADGLRERRLNGTPEQTNATWGIGGVLAFQRQRPEASGWRATVFGRVQRFESRFSAVAPDRGSERAVLDQAVPAHELGGSIRGWRTPGRASLSAGLDARNVVGRSEETSLFTGARRSPGGSQLTAGAYLGAETTAAGNRLSLQASLRGDAWANRDRDGGDRRTLGALSPRLGLSWEAGGITTLRLAAYRAFRAPTLNELYRSFRVGDVTTLPGAQLRDETLLGIEGGVRLAGARQWSIDLAGYWYRLDDAVINATVAVGASGTVRQRENLGVARVAGLEIEGRLRRGRWQLGLDGAWMFSRVLAADRTELVGNELPQVPGGRLGATVEYTSPGGVGALARIGWVGSQFEDDRNLLPLAAGATVDVSLSIPTGARWRLLVSAQNLLDERIEVGRTPVTVLGPPRGLMLGFELLPGSGSPR